MADRSRIASGRGWGTTVAAVALATVAFAAVALGAATRVLAQDPPLACGPVVVDGLSTHVCRGGQVGPTVVFEAGMRDDHRVWTDVAPAVAAFARVVTYDRAGNGLSEAGIPPRTPAAIARELRALLHALDEPGPFLLVGHSIGGWHVRAFAETYPGEVLGLILLDSPHETFEARRLSLLDEEARARRHEALAGSRATLSEAVRQEYEGIEEARDRFGTLPDVPLVVVTAERHDWGPDAPAALESEWLELQRTLSEATPRGRLLVVDRTGHQIPRDRPRLVIELIRDLLFPPEAGR